MRLTAAGQWGVLDMHTETLIVGGGLSGLALARELADRGREFLLVDAQDRLGGRVLGENVGGAQFDLGPAWFWPGQPRIAALVEALGLKRFDQYAAGDAVLEDQNGDVRRIAQFASMDGSWRLAGGFAALIAALAERLPAATLRTSAHVTQLGKTDAGVLATLQSGQSLCAKQVVLALPPRLAKTIAFNPALGAQAERDMGAIPTWMAGQAKALAVYDSPFWRDAGLSGDAISRRGPMVEMHDASPMETGPYALFGFLGISPAHRSDLTGLKAQIRSQLLRVFGPQAEHPIALIVKDWAFDPHVAIAQDHLPLRHHPEYGLPASLASVWDGSLIFSGTEVASKFGGYLEGALEAAASALSALETADP